MKKSGFTLIELSIVLVIIGLIVGGVLVGQDLIRAAQMRSVVSEFEKYQTTLLMFKDKYNAIPGDFDQANMFWPSTSSGNGDKLIGSTESFKFWSHLAEAGLIAGSYTGVTGPGHSTWDAVIGSNVPASKINGVGWFAFSLVDDNGNWGGPALLGDIPGGTWTYSINQLLLGKEWGSLWTRGAFLTPTELYGIDTKIDNGKPGTGIVISNDFLGCVDTNDPIVAATDAANYNLGNDEITCSIIFMPKGTGMWR